MSVLAPDEECVLIPHSLMPGENVEVHKHDNFDEWVIFLHGDLEIIREGLSLRMYSGVQVVDIPAGSTHGARCYESARYYVIRKSNREV